MAPAGKISRGLRGGHGYKGAMTKHAFDVLTARAAQPGPAQRLADPGQGGPEMRAARRLIIPKFPVAANVATTAVRMGAETWA